MKLVWVNPRDPRAGDACGGLDPWEADAQPAGRLSLWERLLVVASGAYAVALFWCLWRMLTSGHPLLRCEADQECWPQSSQEHLRLPPIRPR